MKIFILIVMTLLYALPVYAKETIRSVESIGTKVSDGDAVKVKDDFGTQIRTHLYEVDAPKTGKSNRKAGQEGNLEQPYGEEAFRAQESKIDRRSDSSAITEEERKLLNKPPTSSLVGYKIFFKLVTFIFFGVGIGAFIKFFNKNKTSDTNDASLITNIINHCPKCGMNQPNEILICPDCQIDLVLQSQ